MRRVTLRFAPAGSWVALRSLRGDDEESVTGTDTAAAIALLDRLLLDADGAALRPGEARELVAPDRDRLLADVYVAELGPGIACTITCGMCDAPFDADFALPELMASVYAARPAPEADGMTIRLSDGRRVRLPRGSDELAVIECAPTEREAALLQRLVVEDCASPDDPTALAELESAAPLLDIDLDALCPNCGSSAPVHFDMQRWLLGSILHETSLRTSEIHRLATTYGWSLAEILSLGRARRRGFVAEIERDRALAPQPWSG